MARRFGGRGTGEVRPYGRRPQAQAGVAPYGAPRGGPASRASVPTR